jgi:2-hydroxycyclohexanecarboxyl-CoA dehydrogenase
LAAMQACFPHMRDRGGAIVNVASTTGVAGAPGFAAYAMAKEAIRGLTKVAAREWGRFGITANVICPAAYTDGVREFFADNPSARQSVERATPLGRMGDPYADVAHAVLGLVTDLHYVTGATVMVDGGAHILP